LPDGRGLGPVVSRDGPTSSIDALLQVEGTRTIDLLGFKGFFLNGESCDARFDPLLSRWCSGHGRDDPDRRHGDALEVWCCRLKVLLSRLIYRSKKKRCWVWGGGWLTTWGRCFGPGPRRHATSPVERGSHDRRCDGAGRAFPTRDPDRQVQTKDGSSKREYTGTTCDGRPGYDDPRLAGSGQSGSSLGGLDLRIGSIAVGTMLSSAAGCRATMFWTGGQTGKPDLQMACKGCWRGRGDTRACAFRPGGRRGAHRHLRVPCWSCWGVVFVAAGS